jgi:hypothetical protein
MRESDVARAVRDLLNILVAQGRCYYHVSASSPTIGREGLYRKGQVDIAGWCFCPRGFPVIRPFAWELKGPRGKPPSLEQEHDLAVAEMAGASVAVIRSVDEALDALREMGIDMEQPQGGDRDKGGR